MYVESQVGQDPDILNPFQLEKNSEKISVGKYFAETRILEHFLKIESRFYLNLQAF